MSIGQTGIVVEIRGGKGSAAKLENMGVRPRAALRKVSSYFRMGPQVIEINRMRIALGFSMAERVFVEVRE